LHRRNDSADRPWRALAEESIDIFTALADPAQRGRALILLGMLEHREGQVQRRPAQYRYSPQT
jgi:hypothetical protein